MESNDRYLLIVNPVSGSGSKEKVAQQICSALGSIGIAVDIAETGSAGHARELAAEAAAARRPAVIACGGDGTVNEVASGLVGSDTAMAIVPAGSGNGLARHLGIPMDTAGALDVIGRQNVIRADYGTANGRPFFCTFGVGFDAAVSERCARQKNRGLMMYLRNTVDVFFRYRPEEYIIETNGRVITDKAFLIVCCNASQYGNNAFVAPDASVTDGMLDITIVHGGDLISRATVGADMITGLIGMNALVEIIRTPSVTISRKNEGPAHLDGDAITIGNRIEVNCHPGQLRVFAAGQESSEFIPLLTPARLLFRDIGSSFRGLISTT